MNKEFPLISVVVPIYNVEAYLRRCVDSIIAQDYTNLEIILVNDGSPDHCDEICAEYEKKDSRIHVINKPNGGLGSARNAGIEVMKGEFVAFIDSDDYIDTSMISRLYTLAVENDAQIASCKFCKVYTEDNSIPEHNTEPDIKIWTQKEALYQMFFPNGIGWSACNRLYKSDMFENVRYAEGVYMEDMATTYLVYARADKIVESQEQLYYYYIRENSITGQKSSQRAVDAINNIETIYAFYKENYPEIAEAPLAFYAKIAPNFLVTLNINKFAEETQLKCVQAICSYGKLALKAAFVKKKYKLIIAAFYVILKLCKKNIIQKKWFHSFCKMIGKYVK